MEPRQVRRRPEAKIYLDTPHHDVAGYEPLDDGELIDPAVMV